MELMDFWNLRSCLIKRALSLLVYMQQNARHILPPSDNIKLAHIHTSRVEKNDGEDNRGPYY